MVTVLRVLGFLSIPLVALSVFVVVRHLGEQYRLRTRDLVLTGAVSVAILVLYSVVLDVETSTAQWALGAAGLVVGVVVGRATPMHRRGDHVHAQRTWWTLAMWFVGFAVAQLAVLGALPGGREGGLGAIFVATGLSVGSTLTLALRRSKLAATPATETEPSSDVTCAHCGVPNRPSVRFCSHCGWRVLVPERVEELVP
jgi:hypothetical protein